MLCCFPVKKCLVREFLVNSTAQKQLGYVIFFLCSLIVVHFLKDILFLKLETNQASGNMGFSSCQVTIMGLGKKSVCSAW